MHTWTLVLKKWSHAPGKSSIAWFPGPSEQAMASLILSPSSQLSLLAVQVAQKTPPWLCWAENQPIAFNGLENQPLFQVPAQMNTSWGSQWEPSLPPWGRTSFQCSCEDPSQRGCGREQDALPSPQGWTCMRKAGRDGEDQGGCSLIRLQGGRIEEDSTFLGQISQVLARIQDCSGWGGWASGLSLPREWWLHWPQLSSEQLARYCKRVGKLDAGSRPEIAKNMIAWNMYSRQNSEYQCK